jgi:hypothetical protein
MASKPQRIDPEFENDMRNIMKERYNKGLAKFNMRELGLPESTRLLRKTDGYKMSLEELRIKPKKASA